MANIKTEKNPKKAGRPRLDPTVVVSVRIPKKMKEEISARFGSKWLVLFKEFVRVYLDDFKSLELEKKPNKNL
jgi:hypothetical protein